MINLMPDDMRQEITYARHNRSLIRWVFVVVLVIVGVGLMTLFGQYYISRNTKSLQSIAQITQDRISAQNLQQTQTDIQSLSNNFTTVTQILKKQLLFSKLFVKIGSIIPEGAILSGITLSTTASAIDLNIITANREAATQSYVNISDPANGLFDKADLLSVNCAQITSSSSEAQTKYPCATMVKVVIKTDSSLYFLNSLTTNPAAKP